MTSDEFELVRSKGEIVKFSLSKFINAKNDEETDVLHPNSIAIMQVDIEMEPMDLIRVKLPEGKSDSDIDIRDNTF